MFIICIFVRNVYSACIDSLSVNIKNFPVVTIVQSGIKHRNERHKYLCLNAASFKVTLVPSCRIRTRPQTVVQNPHVNALRSLFAQNIKNLVPYTARLNNKIFDKNKMFRRHKPFFYVGKCFFTARKIRFFRTRIRRIGRRPAQIFCNVADFRVFLKNGGRIFRTGNHNRFGFFFYKAKAFFQPPSAKIHLAHKIQHNSEERKNQNRKQPGKFKFIFSLFVCKIAQKKNAQRKVCPS